MSLHVTIICVQILAIGVHKLDVAFCSFYEDSIHGRVCSFSLDLDEFRASTHFKSDIYIVVHALMIGWQCERLEN